MNRDENFQNAWFVDYTNNISERLSEIKTFAYLVFDQLDTNSNGVIETEELLAALDSPQLSEREKSFIMFLLANQDAISETVKDSTIPNSISRIDIEAYFTMIKSLL
ncbi:MAG: hypothetical protein K2X93_16165 [Candidatus Obscuribacterales bacterium]|nr:hypothetical protein [Candidatus Obscuribacterales bacterium]